MDMTLMKKLLLLTIFLSQFLISELFSQRLQVIPESLNFGVQSPNQIVQPIPFGIRNSFANAVEIEGYEIRGQYSNFFSLADVFPFSIQRNSERRVNVRVFIPESTPDGIYTSVLMLKHNEQGAPPLKVELRVNVRNRDEIENQIGLFVPKITASNGQLFELPVIATNVRTNTRFSGLDCQISFNHTLMTPENPNFIGIFDGGRQLITISERWQPNRLIQSGDTLFTINMRALLGDMPSTPIIINRVAFYVNGLALPPALLNVNLEDGELFLSDIFFDGETPRLVSIVNNFLEMSISPNPVYNQANISVTYQGNVFLQIYNYMGELITDLSPLLPLHTSRQTEIITLNRNDFPSSGVYFARVFPRNQGSANIKTILIFVE